MISDELFDEIMDYEGGFIKYNTEKIENGDCPLTVHELQHICKNYVIENYNIIYIASGYHYLDGYYCTIDGGNQQFYADSEAEAVFKATDYIRNFKSF